MARSSCPKNVVTEQIKAWQGRKKIFNRRQPLLSDWHSLLWVPRLGSCRKKCAMTAYIKKCNNNNMSFVHPLSLAPAHSAYAAAVPMALLHGMCVKDKAQCCHARPERAWWGQATGVVTVISWLQCTHSPFSGREQPHAVLDYSVMWSRGQWLYDTCKVFKHFFLVCGIENARLVLITLCHSGWVWQTHAAHSRLIL